MYNEVYLIPDSGRGSEHRTSGRSGFGSNQIAWRICMDELVGTTIGDVRFLKKSGMGDGDCL